jgi:hypothetical protein
VVSSYQYQQYKAVVGASWAKSALSKYQSASPPWSFQALYAALDATWLQEQEEIEARQIDGKSSARLEPLSGSQISDLLFRDKAYMDVLANQVHDHQSHTNHQTSMHCRLQLPGR